ncbi:CBS domain-containing protein [Actinophytocola oryzae]|uniref:BON domain-containing protein n=1 Tax=Actinophytocola oryzae TaxID=502181 RepID=A0A4R7V1Y9_9PSEU|nr:CBS domain-containing protein [Actinophytocola oryzae]TDV42552.1 BON domain-containing protein [Actinophytocola oryzae]
MRARDVMSRPVISVDTRGTVRDAVTALTEHGFATVPVVDEDGRVIGIFSESDGLRADPHGRTPVTSAMTTPVEVVAPDTDVASIAERMLAGHLRALPVVEEGLLIGMVARRDLLRVLVREDDVITGGVRGLLDQYAGTRRQWSVEVHEGAVTISGDFADDAEKSLVAALARTVAGVTTVGLTASPARTGGED